MAKDQSSAPRPQAAHTSALFHRVTGTFFRAIDPLHIDSALRGSHGPGRYSPAEEPTLYLSSSRAGVSAAMRAHRAPEDPAPAVVTVRVDAPKIMDLRDHEACLRAGISVDDALAPWQAIVAEGGAPPSWSVRRRVLQLGAHGLIDPSRKAPGLWHLVLFTWRTLDGPDSLHPEVADDTPRAELVTTAV